MGDGRRTRRDRARRRADAGCVGLPAAPAFARSNLNTAAFDPAGILWFTGQAGVYGCLDPANGELAAYAAPGGRGPCGITATPDGTVYYASLGGDHIARIDPITRAATTLEPPTPGQGARRIWSDSHGRLWFSEWTVGQLGMFDPAGPTWREWPLPGSAPMPYALYVDEADLVWMSDFASNSIVAFDPFAGTFTAFALPGPGAQVRQLLGRPGGIWGAESALDRLVVLRWPAG